MWKTVVIECTAKRDKLMKQDNLNGGQMRLIPQISNRHYYRSKLKSKSKNIFEDMKEYFIKMEENLNKIFINKNIF